MSPTRQHSKLELVRRRRRATAPKRVLVRYEPCAAEIRAALYGTEADRSALPTEYLQWLDEFKGEELSAERIRGLLFGRSGGWQHQGQPAGEPGEGDVCVHVEYVEAEEFALLQGQDGEGPILTRQHEPAAESPQNGPGGVSRQAGVVDDLGPEDDWIARYVEPPQPEYIDTLASHVYDDPDEPETVAPGEFPKRVVRGYSGLWPPIDPHDIERARELLAAGAEPYDGLGDD